MENKNKSLKIYNGNIEITKENQESWLKKLEYTEIINGSVDVRENATFTAPKLVEVSGSVYVSANATFTAPKLVEVSGYVDVRENATLEKQLWKIASKNVWYVTEKSSEWLLSKNGNFKYRLNNVEFSKEWFDKIRKDELSPEEVFAIDNIEHRRIAFEFMDKAKMKQLKDYKVLDDQIDNDKNPMKILSFTVQNMKTPLTFYNCIEPSTGREYFLQVDGVKTCEEAKKALIGLKGQECEFIKRW